MTEFGCQTSPSGWDSSGSWDLQKQHWGKNVVQVLHFPNKIEVKLYRQESFSVMREETEGGVKTG